MLTFNDIKKLFEEKDIPYETKNEVLLYSHHTEKEKVRMTVACRCEEGTLTLTIFSLSAGEKTPAIVEVLEEANRKYKYWKFSLDQDNDLCMEYQVLTEYIDNPGIYIDMVLIAANIIDDFYSEFQKARFLQKTPQFIDSDLD